MKLSDLQIREYSKKIFEEGMTRKGDNEINYYLGYLKGVWAVAILLNYGTSLSGYIASLHHDLLMHYTGCNK